MNLKVKKFHKSFWLRTGDNNLWKLYGRYGIEKIKCQCGSEVEVVATLNHCENCLQWYNRYGENIEVPIQ